MHITEETALYNLEPGTPDSPRQRPPRHDQRPRTRVHPRPPVRKIKNAGQTIRVVGRLTKPPRRAASTMWTSQRKALARKAFAKSGLGSHGSFDEQETQDATGATPQALEKSAKHGVAGSVGQTDQTSLSEEKAAWHTSVVREYTVDPH